MFASLKKTVAKKLSGYLRYYEMEGVEQQNQRLRSLGMTIGQRVVMYDCMLDPVYPYLISIGNDCTFTGCEILCHDDSSILFNGKRQVGPVAIGSRVFIGRRAIILNNVTIGSDVVIGAGAVVTKDVLSDSVVVGNPARVVGTTQEMVGRKERSARFIPHDFESNFVEDNQHESVKQWAESGFNKWGDGN